MKLICITRLLAIMQGKQFQQVIQNTVLGRLAGDALTTGMNNTVVGYNALGTNTASGAHVAIGYEALDAMNHKYKSV